MKDSTAQLLHRVGVFSVQDHVDLSLHPETQFFNYIEDVAGYSVTVLETVIPQAPKSQIQCLPFHHYHHK